MANVLAIGLHTRDRRRQRRRERMAGGQRDDAGGGEQHAAHGSTSTKQGLTMSTFVAAPNDPDVTPPSRQATTTRGAEVRGESSSPVKVGRYREDVWRAVVPESAGAPGNRRDSGCAMCSFN